jgi:CheY-like chemotaxis protein
MELEVLNFDVHQFLESQMSLIGIMAHEKDLHLNILVDPRVPRILRGDSGRIGQILLNFLTNAVKFTTRGTITLSVELESIAKDTCRVKFAVKDSGIGLDKSQIQRLFEPFMQADGSTARKYGGTGLGLSICKRLTELMTGTIGIDSLPGEGSLFWVTLPLEIPNIKEQEITIPIHTVVEVDAAQLQQRKSVRVLVAEDNHINQMVIMRMLEKLGYSGHLVANGKEAVDAFLTTTYDIVLMDQHMPVMDGIQASEQIRKMQEGTGKRTIIISFSANVLQKEKHESLHHLIDDFILKPVTMSALENSLKKWDQNNL